MQRKQVIFVADSLDNAHKFQQVLSSLDVDVAAGSSAQFKKLLGRHPACDLVVYEARGGASEDVAGIEALLLEDGTASLLVIVGEGQLARFRLPVQVKSDFVMRNASPEEDPGARQRGRHVRLPRRGEHDGEPGNLPGHRGRRAARPHLPRVRAAGLPRHAPLAHVLARRAAAPRVGLRLLRRVPPRGRAHRPW